MAKGKQVVTLNFLYGLPGSGKTFFAEKNWGKMQTIGMYESPWVNNPAVSYIDVDRLSKDYKGAKLAGRIIDEIESSYRKVQSFVIDGLFTSNQQIMDICDWLNQNRVEYHYKLFWWKEDREACLWNDQGRRNLSSISSIENMPFEEPDFEILKKYFKEGNIIPKKVQRKSAFKVWAVENGFSDNGILKSSSWCLGGSWADCWGGSGSVDSDVMPANFQEFDELLEKICPNISFLAYKKIHAECVMIEKYDEGDYYGGSRSHAYYKCDLKKLYNELKMKGLIESKIDDEDVD